MSESGTSSQCRIVVDAMGGDFAPQNAVLGALEALKEDPSIELFLVGDQKQIQEVLDSHKLQFDKNHIIHASEVITMSDTPTIALKSKPDSSIVVGAKYVKDKKADAFVSAGNTGAMMASSTLIIGRLPGVGRPTIGTFMPSEKGVVTIFDVGASVDSKARHLLEYAIMGSIFVKEIYGIEKPRVGVLSVGEEDTKGNEVSLCAFDLIKKTNLNFAGNIEGRDIFKGTVNVVVCDGFVGNIILKFAESFVGLLKSKIKIYAEKSFLNKLRVLFMKGTFKKVMKQFDYQTYGGVPLLGVKGISIIGHGSSSVLAMKNMVLRAKEMFDKKLTQKIEESIKEYANIS